MAKKRYVFLDGYFVKKTLQKGLGAGVEGGEFYASEEKEGF